MDWKNTLEQIVGAAKQAGAAAVDSGKTALETHRINKDIHDAKLALAELYLERYAAGETFDEETAALCDDILENTARAEALGYAAQDARAAAKDAARTAVQNIKAEFTAPDAAEYMDEDAFDALCCPECGFLMDESYRFCPGCGVQLDAVDQLVTDAQEVDAPADADNTENA